MAGLWKFFLPFVLKLCFILVVYTLTYVLTDDNRGDKGLVKDILVTESERVVWPH